MLDKFNSSEWDVIGLTSCYLILQFTVDVGFVMKRLQGDRLTCGEVLFDYYCLYWILAFMVREIPKFSNFPGEFGSIRSHINMLCNRQLIRYLWFECFRSQNSKCSREWNFCASQNKVYGFKLRSCFRCEFPQLAAIVYYCICLHFKSNFCRKSFHWINLRYAMSGEQKPHKMCSKHDARKCQRQINPELITLSHWQYFVRFAK